MLSNISYDNGLFCFYLYNIIVNYINNIYVTSGFTIKRSNQSKTVIWKSIVISHGYRDL